MYILVPKALWDTTVPVHAYDYHVNNGTDDQPDIVSYTPTFREVSELFQNRYGDTIFSPDWENDAVSDTEKHAVLKGEFTMVTLDENSNLIPDVPGELNVLLQAGVLPLTQTQAIRLINVWNGVDNYEL
ncbi:MAG: hypothetical protein ACTHJT_00760 [Cytophaga sp.]|uniref:hypothetical protein n=1 Tax=Cytophaga sp. TaxID=29535 RepID=UPI003F7D0A37